MLRGAWGNVAALCNCDRFVAKAGGYDVHSRASIDCQSAVQAVRLFSPYHRYLGWLTEPQHLLTRPVAPVLLNKRAPGSLILPHHSRDVLAAGRMLR